MPTVDLSITEDIISKPKLLNTKKVEVNLMPKFDDLVYDDLAPSMPSSKKQPGYAMKNVLDTIDKHLYDKDPVYRNRFLKNLIINIQFIIDNPE